MEQILRRLTPSRLLLLAIVLGVVILLVVLAVQAFKDSDFTKEPIEEVGQEEYITRFEYKSDAEWKIAFMEERMTDIVQGGMPVGYKTNYVLHLETEGGNVVYFDVPYEVYENYDESDIITVQIGNDASYVLDETGKNVMHKIDLRK